VAGNFPGGARVALVISGHHDGARARHHVLAVADPDRPECAGTAV